MDKSENGTLIVKIICLLLAFGLWLYVSNVENPARTYELKNVPVELTNIDYLADSKFAIANQQQFTVDLKIEGPSNEVMKVKREDFKIIADMSAYALRYGENTIPVQIISYPENINIKNNGSLGIKVNLEELVKKEFTLKSRVKINYKEHIYEKEQTISPKTVTVIGGKSSIERISDAILTGEENDVDINKESDYRIKFVDSIGNEITNVESDIKTAKLSIVVANGKMVPINLRTSGTMAEGFILDGYELSKNNINILGDISNLNKINSIDTEPVDISTFKSDSEMNVKLNLPEGISAQEGEGNVTVKFRIKKEENLSKNIICNVQYNNLNEGFTVENSNLSTNVIVTGSQAELNKITTQNISAQLDLSNIKSEGTFQYTPKVTLTGENNAVVSDVGSVSIVIKKKS